MDRCLAAGASTARLIAGDPDHIVAADACVDIRGATSAGVALDMIGTGSASPESDEHNHGDGSPNPTRTH
jgi:hypothetical protein